MALARGAGASGLGAFTIAFTAYMFVLGLQRVLISEPLHALKRSTGWAVTDEESRMLGAALIFSFGCAALSAIAGLLLDRVELVVLAAIMPWANLQDAARYVAFRRDRPAVASVADGVWVGLSLLVWPIVANGSAQTAVLFWGLGGAAGAFPALWVLRLKPAYPAASATWWWRHARHLGSKLAIAGLLYSVSEHVAVLGIAVLISDGALGSLRAGQILIQPSIMLLAVVHVFMLPRFAGQDNRTLYGRPPLAISTAAVVGSAVVLGLIMVSFDFLRDLLFGGAIAIGLTLAIPLALGALTSAASAGPALALKADQKGVAFIRARALTASVGLAAIIAGTMIFGVVGAAWGMAAQGAMYLLVMFGAWARARRAAEVLA